MRSSVSKRAARAQIAAKNPKKRASVNHPHSRGYHNHAARVLKKRIREEVRYLVRDLLFPQPASLEPGLRAAWDEVLR